MYLLGKRADLLVDLDILRLIENQVQESKSLDYKREIHLGKDQEKKEFLFDISAMYNTEGGCIVYGIEESKDDRQQNTGKPSNIVDLNISNLDKLVQLIEDLIKTSTEPSISSIIINPIKIEDKTILVLGVPKTYGLPSMVTFNQTNKFYKRRNSGKYGVDVYELNQMFMQNQVLLEKIATFRKNRINDVINKKFLPNVETSTSVFLHIIPANYYDNNIIDFSHVANNLTLELKPMATGGWDKMYNIDGFATFSTSANRETISAYSQVFRSGIFEAYSSEFFWVSADGVLKLDPESLAEEIIPTAIKALGVLNELQVQPPFYISFSLHNVLEKAIYNQRSYINRKFRNDEIILPFLLLENYQSDIKSILKPNFDILYQSIGYANSSM